MYNIYIHVYACVCVCVCICDQASEKVSKVTFSIAQPK